MMEYRPWVSALVIGLMLAQGSLADEALTEQADLSTPRGAVATFFSALAAGDAQRARSAAVPGEENDRMIDAMAELGAAIKSVEAAAVQHFGEEGTLVTRDRDLSEIVGLLDEASVEIDGETATVALPEDHERFSLKRIGDDWRLDIGPMLTGGGETPDEIIAMTGRLTSGARAMAQEIQRGDHETPAAAQRAFNTQLRRIAMERPEE